MDDSDILRCGWVNSLENYDLPNVKYIHESILLGKKNFTKQYLLRKIYRFFTRNKNYINKFETEKRLNKLFNDNGMFFCENGYIEPKLNCNAPIYLEGYFQSQLYFDDIKDDLLKLFSGRQFSEFFTYPGLEKIQNRNSVCISVKVEHNVGSSMYDVCSMEYWESAIEYITRTVENPLFFICSDNVEYVLRNLIDATKYASLDLPMV